MLIFLFLVAIVSSDTIDNCTSTFRISIAHIYVYRWTKIISINCTTAIIFYYVNKTFWLIKWLEYSSYLFLIFFNFVSTKWDSAKTLIDRKSLMLKSIQRGKFLHSFLQWHGNFLFFPNIPKSNHSFLNSRDQFLHSVRTTTTTSV